MKLLGAGGILVFCCEAAPGSLSVLIPMLESLSILGLEGSGSLVCWRAFDDGVLGRPKMDLVRPGVVGGAGNSERSEVSDGEGSKDTLDDCGGGGTTEKLVTVDALIGMGGTSSAVTSTSPPRNESLEGRRLGTGGMTSASGVPPAKEARDTEKDERGGEVGVGRGGTSSSTGRCEAKDARESDRDARKLASEGFFEGARTGLIASSTSSSTSSAESYSGASAGVGGACSERGESREINEIKRVRLRVGVLRSVDAASVELLAGLLFEGVFGRWRKDGDLGSTVEGVRDAVVATDHRECVSVWVSGCAGGRS
ncbi:hypothetical protein BV22DRAFT_749035 [Leucogyrophana mollusca]|uniref:Uncharacterized protein n=1 Tax=Leucogyrophana mollusca TaxID=85980 RepID=A0ACB8B8D4_9AGAM|nr:hypothetical protein BV22DRAFT_749035 [Leucogyrophana mollusca]